MLGPQSRSEAAYQVWVVPSDGVRDMVRGFSEVDLILQATLGRERSILDPSTRGRLPPAHAKVKTDTAVSCHPGTRATGSMHAVSITPLYHIGLFRQKFLERTLFVLHKDVNPYRHGHHSIGRFLHVVDASGRMAGHLRTVSSWYETSRTRTSTIYPSSPTRPALAVFLT
mmetsp:Transcript_1435/g.8823  ORF Transcript_1435/g.8823 Transcript_1435/m.8823 type:complete len:170 (+) Transcript_1435:1937-2446(+)